MPEYCLAMELALVGLDWIGLDCIGLDLFYIRRKKKEACFRRPIYDQGRE